MQKLDKILRDFREEGTFFKTLYRKILCNTLKKKPERWAYWKYMKGRNILNVGCGKDYIPGCLNMDNLQINSYTDYIVKPDLVAEATDLPFPDGGFDVVLASHIFEHQRDYRKFMLEMMRVLRPGGRLILVMPNIDFMGHIHYYRDPTHVIECHATYDWVKFKFGHEGWHLKQFNRMRWWFPFSFEVILEKV